MLKVHVDYRSRIISMKKNPINVSPWLRPGSTSDYALWQDTYLSSTRYYESVTAYNLCSYGDTILQRHGMVSMKSDIHLSFLGHISGTKCAFRY